MSVDVTFMIGLCYKYVVLWDFLDLFYSYGKASVLTSLILLERGLAGSKPIQGWNPFFVKKGDIFMVFNLVLLSVNLVKGSQSGQLSWR